MHVNLNSLFFPSMLPLVLSDTGNTFALAAGFLPQRHVDAEEILGHEGGRSSDFRMEAAHPAHLPARFRGH